MSQAKLKILKRLRPVRLVSLRPLVVRCPEQLVEVWAVVLLLVPMVLVLKLLSAMVPLALYR